MKILFVNPFGIGDILFTTALIKPLKEKGYSVYYWCNERVLDILSYNEAIADIFAFSRGDFKRIFKKSPGKAVKRAIDTIRGIKKEKFDIALDFSLDYRYSLLLQLLGIKRIIGFDYKGRGRFLTERIRIDGFHDRHMVEQYAKLLEFIDRSLKVHGRMELFMGDREKKWASEFLKRYGISDNDVVIGIAAGGGASWGGSAFRKHWPKEKFAYVADKFISDKYKVILFGSESEADICNFISDRMKNKAVNLCGKTDLGQFAAILKRCKLLITNDGGPVHMASALGVRTVSIFGPVDESVYGPYPLSGEHITVKSNVKCRPCYKNFKYPLCENRVCLDSIEPLKVIEAAKTLI